MHDYAVVYTRLARDDLKSLLVFLVEGGATVRDARRYIGTTLETLCESLATMPERGRERNDIRAGLRIMSHRRRTVIAYTVEAQTIVIARVFHGGQDYETFDRL